MPQRKIPENSLTSKEREELIVNNLDLVHLFANRICKDRRMYEDCFQEGCKGLIRASRLYTPIKNGKPVKFNTFAAFEIQCAIRDYIYNNTTVRVVDSNRQAINAYNTKVRELQIKGVDVTSSIQEAIAKDVGLKKEALFFITNPISSLNSCISSDGDDSNELGDYISYECEEDNAEKKLELEEMTEYIRTYFSNIEDKDEEVPKIIIEFIEYQISQCINLDKVKSQNADISRMTESELYSFLKPKTFKDIVYSHYPSYLPDKDDTKEEIERKKREFLPLYDHCNNKFNALRKQLKKLMVANGYIG